MPYPFAILSRMQYPYPSPDQKQGKSRTSAEAGQKPRTSRRTGDGRVHLAVLAGPIGVLAEEAHAPRHEHLVDLGMDR